MNIRIPLYGGQLAPGWKTADILACRAVGLPDGTLWRSIVSPAFRSIQLTLSEHVVPNGPNTWHVTGAAGVALFWRTVNV